MSKTMSRSKIEFETVRTIGLSLPRVEDGKAYGSPALKIQGNLLACIPTHRSAKPDSLAVRIDFTSRSVLLASTPATYYLTDHYRNYPVILVRLSTIEIDALRNLLETASQFVSARHPRRTRKARRAKDFSSDV